MIKNNKLWSVYIVRCADKTFYTGISKNVTNRVKMHNSGKGAKYIIFSRRPVKLVFKYGNIAQKEAMKIEIKIKKLSREKKQKIIKKELSVKNI